MRFSTIFEGETITNVETTLATLEFYVRVATTFCTLDIHFQIVYIMYFQIYSNIELASRVGVQTIVCSEEDRSEITFPVLI